MNFKKFIIVATLAMSLPCLLVAQPKSDVKEEKEEGFVFDTIKVLPITPIKDQNSAGTCWCYSTLGFLEAELLRMGKPEYDFSEMFIVYNTYMDRAEATVRTHGDVSFSQGGSFYDVLYGMKHYGIVPDSEMPAGKMHGDSLSDFSEFSRVTNPFIEGLIKGRKLQMSEDNRPLWKNALAGILDAYIGKRPETFVYNGVTYTPISFFESTGLNMDDYVNLSSYSHHPFYEQFVIEVQDNWRWGKAYNLPVDEFMEVFDYAIENDYPIAWGSDVSEKSWLRGGNSGIAVLPDLDAKSIDKADSDMARWNGLSKEDRAKEYQLKPTPQRWVTQEDRQISYDNYETTDDHGMVIYGKVKDQIGNEYYMVKNSWGDVGNYKGTWFASKAFVRYKTLNIVVHKDALPKAIKNKLKIK